MFHIFFSSLFKILRLFRFFRLLPLTFALPAHLKSTESEPDVMTELNLQRLIWPDTEPSDPSSNQLTIWPFDHLTACPSNHLIIRPSDYLTIWSIWPFDRPTIWLSDRLTIWVPSNPTNWQFDLKHPTTEPEPSSGRANVSFQSYRVI